MKRIGIYLFDDVEVLDFAGLFEVFSTASRVFQRPHPRSGPAFGIITLSESAAKIRRHWADGYRVISSAGIGAALT